MATITNKHEKTAIALVTVAAFAAILIASTIAAVGSADMASARTKKPGTDSVRKLATTSPPSSGRSNSGILVVNRADQANRCSTAGGTSAITDSCANSAASATDISGGVTGSSSSGNSGIAVINKARQSGDCSTAGSSSPIGASCSNAAASATNITGGVNH
jgi:hypothetical protein